jgi:putative hydrolase of the HAD superfamily
LGRSKVEPKPGGRWQTAIFVDLDGTIIRGPFESAVFPAVFGELARKTGLEPGALRRLAVQENLDRQRDPGVPAALAMDWDDVFATIAARLGVQLEASAVALVNAHTRPPYTAVLDGADRMLAQLARPGRAIVIATKGLRKYQLPVLDALGLTPLCADVLTPDTHGAAKGQLAFYGAWPQVTRVQISLGDLYEDDVLAPKRLGFRAIWKHNVVDAELLRAAPLARPGTFAYTKAQPARPDAIVFSLDEVPAVVTALERL